MSFQPTSKGTEKVISLKEEEHFNIGNKGGRHMSVGIFENVSNCSYFNDLLAVILISSI